LRRFIYKARPVIKIGRAFRVDAAVSELI